MKMCFLDYENVFFDYENVFFENCPEMPETLDFTGILGHFFCMSKVVNVLNVINDVNIYIYMDFQILNFVCKKHHFGFFDILSFQKKEVRKWRVMMSISSPMG